LGGLICLGVSVLPKRPSFIFSLSIIASPFFVGNNLLVAEGFNCNCRATKVKGPSKHPSRILTPTNSGANVDFEQDHLDVGVLFGGEPAELLPIAGRSGIVSS
jgi:hypothetical protein